MKNRTPIGVGAVTASRPLELPQFDFEGLPELPKEKRYNDRIKTVKKVNMMTKLPPQKRPGSNNYSRPSSSFQQKIYATDPPIRQLQKKNGITLTRAFMLKCAFAHEPADVLELIIRDKDITEVDTDDLYEFTSLYHLDVSGNYIEFERLAHLPVLRELEMSCNGLILIRVPDDPNSFAALEKLNLSHNNFEDPYLFDHLASLPKLTSLDLSGNNLQMLPDDLSRLVHLKKLNLEGNVLGETVFTALNTIPNLEELNLNKNRIKRVGAVHKMNGLGKIKWLHLGSNQITYYEDLYVLVDWTNLQKVFVWGNVIVNKVKEISTAATELQAVGKEIETSGPLLPVSKNLSVTGGFYDHKVKSVQTYARMVKKKQEVEEENDPSSFFMTATPMLDFQDQSPRSAVPKITDSSEVFNRRSSAQSISSPRVSDKRPKSNLEDALAQLQSANDITVKGPQEDTEKNVIFDYNSDWFQLDETLNKIGENLNNISALKRSSKNDHPLYDMESNLYHMKLGDKKAAFNAMRFALDNPLTISDKTSKPSQKPS